MFELHKENNGRRHDNGRLLVLRYDDTSATKLCWIAYLKLSRFISKNIDVISKHLKHPANTSTIRIIVDVEKESGLPKTITIRQREAIEDKVYKIARRYFEVGEYWYRVFKNENSKTWRGDVGTGAEKGGTCLNIHSIRKKKAMSPLLVGLICAAAGSVISVLLTILLLV